MVTTDCGPVMPLLLIVCFKIKYYFCKDYANLWWTSIERPASIKQPLSSTPTVAS